MSSSFRAKLRPYKRVLQHWLANKPAEFDQDTLPWIDQKNADIDAFLKTFQVPAGYQYDLKEKLTFWRENGYVILEQAIPTDWCDKLWQEVEETIEDNQKYKMTTLVHGLNNHKEVVISDVPVQRLKGTGVRINDYHQASVACKKILTHSTIATFLKAIFNEPVVAFQSLVFKYSSQQGAHQDFPWVTSGIPSHLAAAWIALEDVTEDAGPLFYFPGSHRMKKFNFGNGILYKVGESLFNASHFERFLEKNCAQEGINRKTLLLKKGDLLIWHAALAHGGAKITSNPPKSRKSLVVHYTTKRAYPTALRFQRYDEPMVYENNGISVYEHPLLPEEENSLKMGETWQE